MPEHIPVLTIDGPGGVGKGTVSQLLAKHFGWRFLDSGAIYRVLALAVLRDNCAFNNEPRIVHLAQTLAAEFKDNKAWLDGQDVSTELRSEACSDVASKIAAIPEVRAALLERQRQFAQSPGLVADGRDMGTVVFPEAFLKIYLDATVEERAQRRFLQLKKSGYNAKLADLITDIIQRDLRDKTRAVAPLKPAEDAILVDTSQMKIEEVFNLIVGYAEQRLSKR